MVRLIARAAPSTVRAPDATGLTPLHLAAAALRAHAAREL
eukprot:gene12807-22928_t